MEWREEATVLRRRPHGETAVILDVLTASHGRHAGVVPGGISPKRAAVLQPGSRVMAQWRARHDDQLGTFTIEAVRGRSGLMAGALPLAGLNAVTALLCWALAERDPHPALAARVEGLLDAMEAGRDWAADYLRFELRLLEELGFGLDLTACAVTGAAEGLAFVSPASGRAVTRAGAGDYAPRLLVLPALLGGAEDAGGPAAELAAGLALTGHFLDTRLARQMIGKPVPPARDSLARRLVATLP